MYYIIIGIVVSFIVALLVGRWMRLMDDKYERMIK